MSNMLDEIQRSVDELQRKDFSAGRDIDIPDNPGPSVFGREPVVGSVRRGLDLPVLRDQVPQEFNPQR